MTFKDIYYNLIKTIPAPIEHPVFNTEGKLIIALFEFRAIPQIKHVLNAVLRVYDPKDIGLSIVYGKNNKDFIEKEFKDWQNIVLVNTNDGNHNSHSYSNRLITPELWENFKNWSHSLVYQCDAYLK